uniref:TIL domain-containing protein n=1 Tax=Trichuris muris TaxID=70415 RepID=A0A5S6QQY0_TRIMR
MNAVIVGLALLFGVTESNSKPDDCLEIIQEKQCGENEEFTRCGSACPDTCDDVLHPEKNRECIYVCVIGCQCKSGFVRGPDGKCIPESDCRNTETPSSPMKK